MVKSTHDDMKSLNQQAEDMARRAAKIGLIPDPQKHGGLSGYGDMTPEGNDKTTTLFLIYRDLELVVVRLMSNRLSSNGATVETHEAHCLYREITAALEKRSPVPADWSDVRKIVLRRRGYKAGVEVWGVLDFACEVMHHYYYDGYGVFVNEDGIGKVLDNCDIHLELKDGDNAFFELGLDGALIWSGWDTEPSWETPNARHVVVEDRFAWLKE